MDDVPRRVLDAIGAANARMIALAVTTRRRPGGPQVHHALDLRAPSTPRHEALDTGG